jgi:pyridoxamine-phosphate oxidase
MIKFNNLKQEAPFLIFKKKYDEALLARQKSIEAISISSYNQQTNEVDSRYVNLKFVQNDEFIFFGNYASPKASAFNSHDQIIALVFWPSINAQIRIKSKIKKTSKEFNQKYFSKRSEEKNALAISSNQSQTIESYRKVEENYKLSLKTNDLKKCPEYWGGFSFIPYYFEFWEGHKSRINKREVYTRVKNDWMRSFLQP